jgi:hypothetical protein
MEEEGYLPGISDEELIENYESDAKLCAYSTCQICGHEGLKLRTFIDWSALVYRAFAECPHCGNVEKL